MITGKPISFASETASSTSSSTSFEPGIVGRPAAFMSFRASALSPIWRIMSAVGPMNVKPEATTASANCAFSARNP